MINLTVRKAASAGSFYPRFKPDLIRIIEESFENDKFGPGEKPETINKERRIIGGVSPHAGYVYSGCATAHTFLNLFKEKIPDSVIVLGTDHIGYGKVGLMQDGEWETPLGNIKIDKDLSKAIIEQSNIIISDDSAFMGFPYGREHNIEVQLPFIKYCAKDQDIKFVPIKVGTKNYENLESISNDIANAVKSLNKDIVIVASSDMTHKQPKNISKPQKDLEDMHQKDQAVIEAFKSFSPSRVLKYAQKTSVCGPQTITALMLTCKNLNASQCKAIKYYTSYEKGGGTGPCEYSVGYFSGIIKK
ncbi:MAG: AmmeMemoRadiSam system protein B [Candidatus Lokiarchaeota archaeon]|nr:AmmeMemoRadiSam system protein B [Candidatus Lokiarchaeota archaeon]MBD3338231.1 AmmeMemoRadiSam system protein B [Candidatus Lokiarchaeota archaeon]